jgi:hypothetical protein
VLDHLARVAERKTDAGLHDDKVPEGGLNSMHSARPLEQSPTLSCGRVGGAMPCGAYHSTCSLHCRLIGCDGERSDLMRLTEDVKRPRKLQRCQTRRRAALVLTSRT